MGSFFLLINRFLHALLIIILPCFCTSVIYTNFESPAQLSSLLPPLPPLPLTPALPPIIPELLNFTDQRLALVYPIINAFKNIITSDPLGITQTWVGSDICTYKGFYCDNPPDNQSAVALASIDFNGFQLSAPSIDGFIDQLPDLALFHANSNNFSGTIWSENLNNIFNFFRYILVNIFILLISADVYPKF